MSFSTDTKNELCSLRQERCCALSFVYGAFSFANIWNKDLIKITTENESFSKYISHELLRLFNITPEIKKSTGKNGDLYTIFIDSAAQIRRITLGLGVDISPLSMKIDHRLLSRDCCRNAFIRGAFLSSGSITSPEKAYHLEFATHRAKLAEEFTTLLMEYELHPKLTLRKSNRIIYFKDSNEIEDILNIMGAVKSSFELINEKIVKEIRNDANRRSNCEAANISKTVDAAMVQTAAIKKLKLSRRFEFLPPKLLYIAKLRSENPLASLSELSSLTDPPMSKASINRSLKQIVDIANGKKKEK